MVRLIAELALAPGLVGAATLVGDHWGQRVAGLVSGLPVVVGPLLLIAAQERGLRFTASAANGVLLGLPALGGFALAYARSAHRGPAVGLLRGWMAAAALAALVSLCLAGLPFPCGLLIAAGSLALAFCLMPRVHDAAIQPRRSGSSLKAVQLRMGATAALVLALWAALAVLGPTIGGVLAGFPAVVSVLAVFAHRDGGSDAAISLLRGSLAGMTSFVGFCAVVALLLSRAGLATTFALGSALGLGLQAGTQLWAIRASRSAPRRTAARAV